MEFQSIFVCPFFCELFLLCTCIVLFIAFIYTASNCRTQNTKIGACVFGYSVKPRSSAVFPRAILAPFSDASPIGFVSVPSPLFRLVPFRRYTRHLPRSTCTGRTSSSLFRTMSTRRMRTRSIFSMENTMRRTVPRCVSEL